MINYTNKDAVCAAKIVFPQASESVEISKGFSHSIFEVKTKDKPESVIIKFANQNSKKFDLSKEVKTQEFLRNVNVSVPKVILHNKPNEKNPHEFLILEKIDGEDLDDVWGNLTEDEKLTLAKDMGELLGKIHKTKFDKYGYISGSGLEPENDLSFSLKSSGKKKEANKAVFNVLSVGFSDLGGLIAFDFVNHEDLIKIFNYLVTNKDIVKTEENPSLIHMDFEPRNIRVKK